ncbi:helix-turn-helix transcriptional regulator [Mammaliicoccus sp. Dog046]|uniref:helix-turn-helix transcriptional regulator n=1 Tax=Mammaliicoccus sp. Dog046 TaxID=3034233 RepID=UPI002B25A9AC|nr:helix-turn-helix transcriptional regulator [Mammaliicoccus sp. Dog046]WQK85671.1 helix-turn-helix transcriptional regulator [Mammaliicoccus sp. Dog046]
MELGIKLEFERRIRGLDKKELADILNDFTQSRFYTKRKIKDLESNRCDFTYRIINDLASYFSISISEFLEKDWESYNKSEIRSINFNIEEYFHGHSNGMPKTFKNLSDIIPNFDLVKSRDWVSLPKYDFIMRDYYDFLFKDVSKESSDILFYRSVSFVDHLEMFGAFEHKNTWKFPINLEIDSAGYTSFNDKREPIDMNALIHNIEFAQSEIRSVFEEDYYDYHDESKIGLQLLSEYRERQDIEIQDIEKDINISSSEFLQWEMNNKQPKIEDVIKVCDYLGINIDLLSYNTLRTMNNMNSQTIAEFILYNTEVQNLKELTETYFFSDRQSMFLIPKYCYTYMFNYLNDNRQKKRGVKEAFQFTKEFFIKWYEFNKVRQLLFYKLEGLVAKTNFIHYSEEEIKSYLGNSYYPENPVKLLTQLVLDRVGSYGYKDKAQVINSVRSIDIERLLQPTEKLNLRPEISDTET